MLRKCESDPKELNNPGKYIRNDARESSMETTMQTILSPMLNAVVILHHSRHKSYLPTYFYDRFVIPHLRLLKEDGLSASIYTQPFDVEGEQNGLMTYDREVVKIPFEALRKIHTPLNASGGVFQNVGGVY